MAQHWIDAGDVRVRSEEEDDSHWWTVLGDPALNELVQTAYRQNLTLREAGYRVLEARAQLGIAFGEFFPQTQEMNGDVRSHGVSTNVANARGCVYDDSPKALPLVPPNAKGCADDYCPRACPLFLGGLCEPWYTCGPPRGGPSRP